MAGRSSIAEKVHGLVESAIEALHMDLIDTEYVKEGSRWFLRLYIDKPEGVTIDDCQLVHEAVIGLIDAADPISGPYTFEVSSPGLDRPLKTDKDFMRNIGQDIELSLYAPDVHGQKAYTGILTGYENGIVTIRPDRSETEISFTLKEISLMRKTIKF